MAAASRIPAQVPSLFTRRPGEGIPRRPPSTERSTTRTAGFPASFGDLADVTSAALLRNLSGLTEELDAVLEAAKHRLTDGERTRLAETTHAGRRLQSIAWSMNKAAEIGHASWGDLVDCERLLLEITAGLDDMLLDTGGRILWNELPELRTVRPALSFVFRELILNALRYRSADEPEILVRSERGDRCWIFMVDDNGIGIDRRHWISIFDPFFTVDPRAWRPGLGLSVCRLAVERMGGVLSVQDSARNGCLFTFSVPDSLVAG